VRPSLRAATLYAYSR